MLIFCFLLMWDLIEAGRFLTGDAEARVTIEGAK
jgi:hypothetical protein